MGGIKCKKVGKKFQQSAFRGYHSHLIDEKGRLSIPVQFREVLANVYKEQRLILTSLVSCLVAYPLSEWLKIEEQVKSLPQMKPEVRDFQRVFISPAEECGFDRQGRILIPPALRAGLRKEVVIVGMLTKFEIWAREKFEEKRKKVLEDSERISNVLGDLGL